MRQIGWAQINSSRVRSLVILAALLFIVRATLAHPVHIQRGIVTVTDDHLDVELAISGHEAEHLGTTTGAIADELQRSLFIFDEYGVRLTPGRVVTTQITQSGDLSLQLSYVTNSDCRYLTLQQRIPGDALAHHRQMQLTIARPGDADSEPLITRLSNAGNAVTIKCQPSQPSPELGDGDPYRDPLLLLLPTDAGTRLELHVPAPLMETWLPLERARQNVITADDLRVMSLVLRGWFRQRFSLDDQSNAVSLRTVQLLRPGDVSVDRPTHRTLRNRDVGFWCARIAFVAEVRHTTGAPAVLKCSAFNSAVLSLPAYVIDEQLHIQRQETVSTYSPSIRLDLLSSQDVIPVSSSAQ